MYNSLVEAYTKLVTPNIAFITAKNILITGIIALMIIYSHQIV